MTLGFRTGDICYATSAEAVDAYYSGIPPYILTASTASITYVHRYEKQGASWKFIKGQYNSTGVPTTTYTASAPIITPPSCQITNDPVSNFNDGMTIGWGVAAAMIIAFLIRRVHR